MSTTRNCATCRNCAVIDGACRRNPPVPFVVPGPHGMPTAISAWPPVQPHQWCGEYQRAEEAELEVRTAEAVKAAQGAEPPKVSLA